MRMTIAQLEECERLLGTTCCLQFNEPPANYELALRQLNALPCYYIIYSLETTKITSNLRFKCEIVYLHTLALKNANMREL